LIWELQARSEIERLRQLRDPNSGVCADYAPNPLGVGRAWGDQNFVDGHAVPETCDLATGVCKAGTPPVCDDGDPCTSDGCTAAERCGSEPVDLATLRAAIAEGMGARVCDGEPIASVIKLLGRASSLLDRAERAPAAKAAKRRLVQAARALRKAAKRAAKSGREPISADCVGALDASIDDARTLTSCVALRATSCHCSLR